MAVPYNEILSTTLANHMPKLVDNIFTARPFVYFLKESGNIRLVGGGHQIQIPLLYGLNTTASSYAGYDLLTTGAQTGITMAYYPWKQYAVTIQINGLEEAENSSEEAIIDLLEAKTQQAEHTVLEKFDEMFIDSDGTGNGGDDWLGLETLVNQNTTSVGGIDPSVETWWQSYRETTATTLAISQMSTAYNTVAEGNDQPNVILTTQTLYEKYESLLQPQLRFADAKTADAGFQNLLYKGAPVVFDSYVNTGLMYFLNTKYLRLVGHKDNWFKATPFVRPSNYDARYAQILCYGNLTVSNRSRQGVLTGKTA